VTIVTTLPKSWSIQEVQEVLQSASNCMIRTAKQLVIDQGISPNPKPGKTVHEVTAEDVKRLLLE
jgi:hypothetical protein